MDFMNFMAVMNLMNLMNLMKLMKLMKLMNVMNDQVSAFRNLHGGSRDSPVRSLGVGLSKRTGLVSWRVKPSLKTGVIHGGRSGSSFHKISLLGRSPESSMVFSYRVIGRCLSSGS